jgi:CDP-diacylglycerol---glycerol-3-phosphate 3-phosphatidyltransferase
MASSPSSASAPTSSMGMLAPFTNELDHIAPSFNIDGTQIQILQTPADFYETLKVRFTYGGKLGVILLMLIGTLGPNTKCGETNIPIYFVYREI